MRPRDGLRRDLRLSLADALGYGAMAGVAEVYLPAFGLALGMSPVLAGLLASVPLLAGGVLQLVAPRVIQRVRSLRRWVAVCMAVQAASFIPLGIVALTHHLRTTAARSGEAEPGQIATGVVFAAASLYWGAGMAASAGWTPWTGRVVPSRIRSRFFGRRQGLMQAAMLAGLIGSGAALRAATGTSHILAVYAGMFGLAFVARLVSAVAVARQGTGIDTTPRRRMRLRSIPPRLRGTPRGAMLGYLVAALAAASIAGPFIAPYLLAHHGLSYLQYSVFAAVIVVVKIIAMPLVGKALHRTSLRRVITVSALGIAPIPLLWLVSDSFWWFLAIQTYSGIAWAGFELGMLMALFDAEDDAERTATQVAFSALQAVGAAGASLIGGFVLGAFGTDHHAYLAVFIVSSVARFAAVMLLVRRLPMLLARLPFTVVTRAWTLAEDLLRFWRAR